MVLEPQRWFQGSLSVKAVLAVLPWDRTPPWSPQGSTLRDPEGRKLISPTSLKLDTRGGAGGRAAAWPSQCGGQTPASGSFTQDAGCVRRGVAGNEHPGGGPGARKPGHHFLHAGRASGTSGPGLLVHAASPPPSAPELWLRSAGKLQWWGAASPTPRLPAAATAALQALEAEVGGLHHLRVPQPGPVSRCSLLRGGRPWT